MIVKPKSDLIQTVPKLELADDASESSTFYVGSSPPRKTRRCSGRVRKSVVIDESLNTCIETHYPQEEMEERWYTAYEVQGLRTMNGFELRKMYREAGAKEDCASAKAVLQFTYEACQGMLYDDIEVLCPDETAQLRRALHETPTGLASYASSTIRRDVRARRRKVVDVVRLIQRAVRDDMHDDAVADYIRASVETVSRPSRLFAQLVAEESL